MNLGAFAPAKVNLYLHVGPVDAEGYHPLSSLVVFADVGDRLSVGPGDVNELTVQGPFAEGVGPYNDNLVLRALAGIQKLAGVPLPPVRLLLDKQLPIAAGLGGGTADGAAALRLLDRAFGLESPAAALEEAAARLGADGCMCLHGAPVIATGRGELLAPAPGLPALHAVLVNPGAPSLTGAVYGAYDAAGARGRADTPAMPEAFESVEELAAFLSLTRNDLQPPACALEPRIAEVLERLAEAPEVLLARMSGSGATCFALCAGDFEAGGLADGLSLERPDWWVRPCRLGGPWPDGA